jgi:hypothetical protein
MHWSRSGGAAAALPWVALGVALATAACLGDVSIEGPLDDAGDAGEPNTDVRTREPLCQSGLVRCEGSWVERCMAIEADGPMRWVRIEDCSAAALCVPPGMCVTAACELRELACAGSQLQRCNSVRTGFTNVGPPCLRDELCSAERGRCDVCVPSRRECTPDLGSSRTCAADGNSFGPSTFCPLGCVIEDGTCSTCSIASYVCDAGVLSRCNDGLSFTPLGRVAECAGSTRVGCDGDTLQSLPCGAFGCNAARSACNECAGQARVCDGATAFRACQPDGTYGPLTDCQDGLSCTAQGQCVCTTDAASCAGGALLVCNAFGNAIVAGERCSGPGNNVLRTCSAGELTTNTCASAALCDAAAGADCPACLDGQNTCD